MFGMRTSDVQILEWVVRKHGFAPESDWIRDVRRKLGVRVIHTSDEMPVSNPCPPEKQTAIVQAFHAFGMYP